MPTLQGECAAGETRDDNGSEGIKTFGASKLPRGGTPRISQMRTAQRQSDHTVKLRNAERLSFLAFSGVDGQILSANARIPPDWGLRADRREFDLGIDKAV